MWKRVKIKDVAIISTGFPFDGHLYSKKGVRVLRGENISDGILKWDERIDKRWNTDFPQSDLYSLQDGDIVLQMDGNVGKNKARVTTQDLPMYIAQRVGCIRAKENASQDFLYYITQTESFRRYLQSISTGTSIQHISLNQIGNFEFDIPPLPTQRKVAELLSALDQKIALNRTINQQLEQLARTIYNYYFLQFHTPLTPLHDTPSRPQHPNTPTLTYNPILKKNIPIGWEYITVDKLTNVVTGKEDANFSTPNGQYPFFTCSKENLYCDKAAFSGKAILIAGNGDFNVKHYTGEFNAYQRTYVLIPNDPKYYGVLYFAAKDKIASFKAKSNGSIIKFITKGDIESIGIYECNHLGVYEQINTLLDRIEHNNKEIITLTTYRDALLPLLMNGQVEVKV